MPFLTLFVGLALLLVGGEALVRGAVTLARCLCVSPLVIGLTLVGFGTSMPELVASVQAALIGAPAIAIGNIVGSNIANVLLILGVAAVLMPLATSAIVMRRDGTVLLAASLLMVAVVLSGSLARPFGIALVLALAVYTVGSFVLDRRNGGADDQLDLPQAGGTALTALLLAVAGIAGVVIGAELLVNAAVAIADLAGLSQAVVGLTIVAIGTSLPELATSVVAAVRRQGDVALGNVIGSNIFNILGIAGITAMVKPIPIPPEIGRLDIWIMLAAALLLLAFAATGRGISRAEGAILLICYGVYLTLQFSPGMRALVGL